MCNCTQKNVKIKLFPQASAAPADAAYSGLLECPCTDRVVKKVRPGVETRDT